MTWRRMTEYEIGLAYEKHARTVSGPRYAVKVFLATSFCVFMLLGVITLGVTERARYGGGVRYDIRDLIDDIAWMSVVSILLAFVLTPVWRWLRIMRHKSERREWLLLGDPKVTSLICPSCRTIMPDSRPRCGCESTPERLALWLFDE